MSAQTYPVLHDAHVDVIPFFRNWVNFMMIFFPITSFVLIPAVQGTTVITVLSFLMFMLVVALPAGANKWAFIKELFIFLIVFAFFSVISQFLNLIDNVQLNKKLLLVNSGQYLDDFYRSSHLTQALYLTVAYIIYLAVKYFATDSVIKYVYWGLRLLCIYGLYEVFFYFATGMKGDFITNRQFGENSASLVQTAPIPGLRLIRMKSLTGEPSMFAFSVFPFWALAYGLKRKFDRNLLFCCLLLTFSTTAYGAMVLFQFSWFLYKKKYKQIIYVLIGLFVILAALQVDAVSEKSSSIYDSVFGNKLDSGSGRSRSGKIENHFGFWLQLNAWSRAFGIGFGYIRSTDFFTTILVNNGWLGLLTFSGFFFYNRLLKATSGDLAFAYYAGLIILFLIMMASVPEFAYPSLWIYLALSFVIDKFKLAATPPEISAQTQLNPKN